MENLPIVLQNIIIEYKRQLDITEIFNECILDINKIRYFLWDNLDENLTNNISLRDNTSYILQQMYPGFILGIHNIKTGLDVIF